MFGHLRLVVISKGRLAFASRGLRADSSTRCQEARDFEWFMLAVPERAGSGTAESGMVVEYYVSLSSKCGLSSKPGQNMKNG